MIVFIVPEPKQIVRAVSAPTPFHPLSLRWYPGASSVASESPEWRNGINSTKEASPWSQPPGRGDSASLGLAWSELHWSIHAAAAICRLFGKTPTALAKSETESRQAGLEISFIKTERKGWGEKPGGEIASRKTFFTFFVILARGNPALRCKDA